MDEQIELKPCPFCGRTPTVTENKLNLKSILYGVICFGGENHSAGVGYFQTEEEAAKHWNRRADNEQREAD